jgi:hypothetical protein
MELGELVKGDRLLQTENELVSGKLANRRQRANTYMEKKREEATRRTSVSQMPIAFSKPKFYKNNTRK